VHFKVGALIGQQEATIAELQATWRAADELGLDSLWFWDHFLPLYGDRAAPHFEAYTLLAAAAIDTRRVGLGTLVTCNSYRNPNLVADMARTIDHLSGGRFTLGIGAGWFEPDFIEYGYEFGTMGDRLRALERALPVIRERIGRLSPAPAGRLPLLVGGNGEKVTLRLVAEHADIWNADEGPPDAFAHRNGVLDDWCRTVGRDPATIERTILISPDEVGDWGAYVDAGARHVIVELRYPFDLTPVRELLAAARP
jgi:probable F420-dependent oxidoreductase